jgi:hypothetical protein
MAGLEGKRMPLLAVLFPLFDEWKALIRCDISFFS